MDRHNRQLLGLIAAGASIAHATATKRPNPIHGLIVLLGLLGGFGDGPASGGHPVRRR